MCRNFLWVDKDPKVGWKHICLPKDEGGLGVRNCRFWNQAMLFKILWDIQANKNTLWFRWVHEVYLRRRNIWEWRAGRDDPPLFKKLAKLRYLLLQNTGSIRASIDPLSSWQIEGKLSLSKAYDWLRPKMECKPWMSLIWRNSIPPKFSFILWLSFWKRL